MSDFIIENSVLAKYIGTDDDVLIPNGVSKIEKEAFEGCTGLTSISTPASVTQIADWTFSGCEDFTIHAPLGSYAEQYAKKHNIHFEAY